MARPHSCEATRSPVIGCAPTPPAGCRNQSVTPRSPPAPASPPPPAPASTSDSSVRQNLQRSFHFNHNRICSVSWEGVTTQAADNEEGIQLLFGYSKYDQWTVRKLPLKCEHCFSLFHSLVNSFLDKTSNKEAFLWTFGNSNQRFLTF